MISGGELVMRDIKIFGITFVIFNFAIYRDIFKTLFSSNKSNISSLPNALCAENHPDSITASQISQNTTFTIYHGTEDFYDQNFASLISQPIF